MATKIEHQDLEVAHFNHFKDRIEGMKDQDPATIEFMLQKGMTQVSTAFENALADFGGHELVSQDRGDLYRDGAYSDAKLATVRTSGYGLRYSAPVTNIFNKTGSLRVQVYERKQNKFFYFVIPRRAYKHIPKTSNIEIPFEMDGTPRRIPSRPVRQNWWRYEVSTWEEMATK